MLRLWFKLRLKLKLKLKVSAASLRPLSVGQGSSPPPVVGQEALLH